MPKFYLTTPIYYVNAAPHIGHAYTNIISDCLARYQRLCGKEVFFLTGTDEHGEKIKQAADTVQKPPKDFVDSVVVNFKSLWEVLEVGYDDFIRTTERRHIEVVQSALRTLHAKGDIYKSQYRGFYCMPCETFFTASQIEEADGTCPTCSRAVEEIVEENYFFRLSKYESWLKEHLADNPGCVKPHIRYNEVVGFLQTHPLEDLCISRPKARVRWGIDFPLDDNFVTYVWFDALLNYISAVKFSKDQAYFSKWWPADIHFIGKDILRHHAVFWPIMLHALGVAVPKVVFAHGWWKVGEEKMSKSTGNIVSPVELVKRIGPDALRYFLLREVTPGMDGSYSWESIRNRINSDLANDLGNLVYRVLNMSEKYFNGTIRCPEKKGWPETFTPFIEDTFLKAYTLYMENIEFPSALKKVWSFINVMNKHIEETKPWVLKKEGKNEKLQHFVWSLLQGIRIVAYCIYPFMPQTSEIILRQMGKELDVKKGLPGSILWIPKTEFRLDYTVKKEAPLFPRIDAD